MILQELVRVPHACVQVIKKRMPMAIVSARVTGLLQFATVPRMNLIVFAQTAVHVLLAKLRFSRHVGDVLNGWGIAVVHHSVYVKVTRLRT